MGPFVDSVANIPKIGSILVGEKSDDKVEYRIGVLAPDDNDYTVSPMSLNSTVVAVKYSLEKLGKYFLPGFYFNVSYADSKCANKASSVASTLMYTEFRVQAFFGPMCTTVLPWITRLSDIYSLNSMTVGCHSKANGEFSNTTVRLMSPYTYNTDSEVDNYPDFYNAVTTTFAHFGWGKDLALISKYYLPQKQLDDVDSLPARSFYLEWTRQNAGVGIESFMLGLEPEVLFDGTEKLNELTKHQLMFASWTRVLVLGLSPNIMRQFLYQVFCVRNDEFNIAEYAIVYMQPGYITETNIENQLWRDPELHVAHVQNFCLKKVFRHVLIFKHENLFEGQLKKYEKIRSDFKAECNQSVFNSCSIPDSASYLQYVAATYDGTELLLKVGWPN